MAKLTPYIMSEDARAQADFYIQALGGEILSVMTHGQLPDASEANKDKVMHLSMVAGGVGLFLCDFGFGTISHGNNVHLSLEFESEAEAREAFEKLSEGGRVGHPLERAFWGSLFGQVEDKFGILWMISTEAAQAEA
ncbi:VOC family protein [Paenibacillus sp. P26]|nr:VOC family protein [Paenibacillus sp. P26]UUZ90973.1 VOC family protein [Paenibacillus sp. P25]